MAAEEATVVRVVLYDCLKDVLCGPGVGGVAVNELVDGLLDTGEGGLVDEVGDFEYLGTVSLSGQNQVNLT